MKNSFNEKIIHSLYEAALTPELMQGALAQTARFLEARSIIFHHLNSITKELGFLYLYEIHEETFRSILGDLGNKASVVTFRQPVGTIINLRELMSATAIAEFIRTHFWNDVLEPAGLGNAVGAHLGIDGNWYTSFSAYRTSRDASFGARHSELLGNLYPHLQRVAQIRLRLAEVDLQRAAALETLERLATAIFLVDGMHKVLFANAKARELIRRADGLLLTRDGLRGGSPEITRALRNAIADAAQVGSGSAVGSGGSVVLVRPSGEPSLIATIAPLRGHALATGTRRAAAAVFVADPQSAIAVRSDALAVLYGLTPAEARVSLLVAEGEGLPRIAKALGVSPSTVRTQLANVLEKTGTRGQVELAVLLQRIEAQRPVEPE